MCVCVCSAKNSQEKIEKKDKKCVLVARHKKTEHTLKLWKRCYIANEVAKIVGVCVPEKVSMKDNILCAVLFFRAYLRTKDTMHKILDF